MFFRLLRPCLAAGLVLLLASAARADEVAVTLRLDPQTTLARVPPDFLGFGYETSAVAQKVYFIHDNRLLVQLYQTLAPHGIVRIGGNVSDTPATNPTAHPPPTPRKNRASSTAPTSPTSARSCARRAGRPSGA